MPRIGSEDFVMTPIRAEGPRPIQSAGVHVASRNEWHGRCAHTLLQMGLQSVRVATILHVVVDFENVKNGLKGIF